MGLVCRCHLIGKQSPVVVFCSAAVETDPNQVFVSTCLHVGCQQKKKKTDEVGENTTQLGGARGGRGRAFFFHITLQLLLLLYCKIYRTTLQQ